MKKQQECTDHRVWDKSFTIAFWLLLAMAWYLLLFTEATWQAIIFITGSTVFWYLRTRNDIRHAEWHLKNDKKGKNDAGYYSRKK